MKEVDSSIKDNDDQVLVLVNKLQSLGKTTQKYLVKLLKGYQACKYVEFFKKKKKDDHK